jgi:hypothetical protein
MSVVEIAGDRARIRVEVLGYENTNAQTLDDANWLSSEVAFDIGGVRGALSAALTTHDFAHLHADLGSALDALTGEARLETYEDALALAVDLGGGGRASVSGRIRASEAPRVTVTFAFDSDQSYLARVRAELRALVRAYPVVTSLPNAPA